MKKFKVVLADIDGTLYGDDHILSQENRDAIIRLHQAGIYFGLASGRDVGDLAKYPSNWNLDFDFDVYVAMNGAQLRDNIAHEDSNSHLMKTDDLLKIIKHMEPLNLTYCFFAVDGNQYVNRIDEDIVDSQIRNHYIAYLINDYRMFDTLPVLKILFRIPPGKMEEVIQFFKDHPLEGFSGFRTHPVCYEVMKAGVSKATALTRFCERHNIALDEVIAFGDTTNDVEMLKAAYGVCLCNGTQDALSVADDITEYPCDQSGFADYINKHVL